jgi:hypothetical protein
MNQRCCGDTMLDVVAITDKIATEVEMVRISIREKAF